MANAVSGIVLLLVLGGFTLYPATADEFCDNLKQVAATLPKNTASSPLHFATTVIGQAPDAVYALALCCSDIVNDSACGGCVASTFDIVITPPPSQQQCYQAAYYYAGACSLVYYADNILTSSSNTTTGNNGDDTPFTLWNVKSWGNWSTNQWRS